MTVEGSPNLVGPLLAFVFVKTFASFVGPFGRPAHTSEGWLDRIQHSLGAAIGLVWSAISGSAIHCT